MGNRFFSLNDTKAEDRNPLLDDPEDKEEDERSESSKLLADIDRVMEDEDPPEASRYEKVKKHLLAADNILMSNIGEKKKSELPEHTLGDGQKETKF